MRCVRMGSRAADESAATEGARPDDGGQDDSGSEVDAWASSEDEEGLDSGAWDSRDAHAASFSGEMEFSGLPRNSLVESLVVRRNRWHLYQDSGAESKWRRIYDGRERLGALLSRDRT